MAHSVLCGGVGNPKLAPFWHTPASAGPVAPVLVASSPRLLSGAENHALAPRPIRRPRHRGPVHLLQRPSRCRRPGLHPLRRRTSMGRPVRGVGPPRRPRGGRAAGRRPLHPRFWRLRDRLHLPHLQHEQGHHRCGGGIPDRGRLAALGPGDAGVLAPPRDGQPAGDPSVRNARARRGVPAQRGRPPLPPRARVAQHHDRGPADAPRRLHLLLLPRAHGHDAPPPGGGRAGGAHAAGAAARARRLPRGGRGGGARRRQRGKRAAARAAAARLAAGHSVHVRPGHGRAGPRARGGVGAAPGRTAEPARAGAAGHERYGLLHARLPMRSSNPGPAGRRPLRRSRVRTPHRVGAATPPSRGAPRRRASPPSTTRPTASCARARGARAAAAAAARARPSRPRGAPRRRRRT